MVNKKGLSNIVATVLIVLLVLAAVAIVWGFLRPTFDDASSTVTLGQACLSVELEATRCDYSTLGSDVLVVYKLVSDGEMLNRVVVVVEDSSLATVVVDGVKPAGALQSESVSGVVTVGLVWAADDPFVAKVAAVVSDGAGNEKVCPESAGVVCGVVA